MIRASGRQLFQRGDHRLGGRHLAHRNRIDSIFAARSNVCQQMLLTAPSF
jgi:hypothetical protein